MTQLGFGDMFMSNITPRSLAEGTLLALSFSQGKLHDNFKHFLAFDVFLEEAVLSFFDFLEDCEHSTEQQCFVNLRSEDQYSSLCP